MNTNNEKHDDGSLIITDQIQHSIPTPLNKGSIVNEIEESEKMDLKSSKVTIEDN